MAADDPLKTDPGLTGPSTALWTPPLALLTSIPDPPGEGCSTWQQLTIDHSRYKPFRYALMWQDDWDYVEHLTWWQTHLELWPRVSAKPSRIGFLVRHAAFWLRAGYSQKQVGLALGYKPGNAPKSLWRHATEYRDWLERSAPKVRPDSLEAVAALEDMMATGVEVRSGRQSAEPYVLSTQTFADPNAARRYVRRRWRTPRVVTVGEWHREPFGWPAEDISVGLLYGEFDLRVIERAEQRLAEVEPYHRTGDPPRAMA